MSLLETSSETLITLFHLILNIKFAWCNSSRIERDNCCQRERSGGKDMPPIRNRMHQVKLHQRAFMASGVKWIRCKLHVIVDWKLRCNNGWTLSKHSMSLSGKTNSKLRTWLQKTNATTANNKRLRIHSTIAIDIALHSDGCWLNGMLERTPEFFSKWRALRANPSTIHLHPLITAKSTNTSLSQSNKHTSRAATYSKLLK